MPGEPSSRKLKNANERSDSMGGAHLADSHPSAEQLQSDYLDLGSDGLHTFAKVRGITGASIAATLAKTPAIYSDAKQCAEVLPQVRERLEAAMRKLAELYPNASSCL